MTEKVKKHIKSKRDAERLTKKTKSFQEENSQLKLRIGGLESENRILKDENNIYLKAIKLKIKAETMDKERNVNTVEDTMEKEDVDLKTKNDVLLLVVKRSEELNESLREQLCHAFLYCKDTPSSDYKYRIEDIKDMMDKYFIHLELNELLRNENAILQKNNTTLKEILNDFYCVNTENSVKKRRMTNFTGDQLTQCDLNPVTVYEEHSYKVKYHNFIIEYEGLLNECSRLIYTLKQLILGCSTNIEYAFSNFNILKENLISKLNLIRNYVDNENIMYQNIENLENMCNLHEKNNIEFEELLKAANMIIEEKDEEIEFMKQEKLASDQNNEAYIEMLCKENEELREKLKVFDEVMENLGSEMLPDHDVEINQNEDKQSE